MSKSRVTTEEIAPGIMLEKTARYRHRANKKYPSEDAGPETLKALLDEMVDAKIGGIGFIEAELAIAKAFLEARGLPNDATIYYRLLPNGEKEIVSRKAAEDLRRTNDKHRVGCASLSSWMAWQGCPSLNDEAVAAKLIWFGHLALDPESRRQVAIDAAVQFGRLAMVWGDMRDKDAAQRSRGKQPKQKHQLMRAAIEGWVRANPGKKPTQLLRLLPEDEPSDPNAGGYMIWMEEKSIFKMVNGIERGRKVKTIHARRDSDGKPTHCGKSTFYEHVRLLIG